MEEWKICGTSKWRWISEDTIEMVCSMWWDIEYDTNSLYILIKKEGKDIKDIKKIIIRFKYGGK